MNNNKNKFKIIFNIINLNVQNFPLELNIFVHVFIKKNVK